MAAPAPAAPPRGPGSDCAKQDVAVNRAARHVHSRVILQTLTTFIGLPTTMALDRAHRCCCSRIDFFLQTEGWIRFLLSRNDVRGVLAPELLTSGPERVQGLVGLAGNISET